MSRRQFITLLGGAAAWPLAARAQARMKRVGFMIGQVEDEDTRPRLSALRLGLEALGWVEGELGGRGDGGVYACADCIKEPGGIQQAITDHITGFRACAEKTHRLHRISTRPS